MSVLPVWNITSGVHTYGWKDNQFYGDCVEAAFEDLYELKRLNFAGKLRKDIADVHGIPPRNRHTFRMYAKYLATLGERPGGNVGSSPTGFLEWARQQGVIYEWATMPIGDDRALSALQAAQRYNGAIMTVYLTEDMYEGFEQHASWGADLGYGSTPLASLAHEVALVRSTGDKLVIATWNRNKVMTQECANETIMQVNCFLSNGDTPDPEFDAKLAELTALRTGNAQGT